MNSFLRKLILSFRPYNGRTRFANQWAFYDELKPCLAKVRPGHRSKDERIIWMYWGQGFNQAPPIVDLCVKSIQNNARDCRLMLIDDESLGEYIKIPDDILRYHESGRIMHGWYSDLVRISLLHTYGGIWLDATCYLTESIPEYVWDSEMFVFKTPLFDYVGPIKASNWFIRSCSGNEHLLALKETLEDYWRCGRYPRDYYLFHIAQSALIDQNPAIKDSWEMIPYVCNQNAHVFQYSFFRRYSDFLLNHCLNSSFVHKLTYKYDASQPAFQGSLLQGFLKSMSADVPLNSK